MPDRREVPDATGLAGTVARALDALEPCIAALVADDAVSGEHGVHIVVMDPAAARERVAFESAIVLEPSVRDRGAYPWYDTAFAAMSIELVNARLRHVVADARSGSATW